MRDRKKPTNLATAAVTAAVASPTVGAATYSFSNYFRSKKLKQEKLELQEKLQEAKENAKLDRYRMEVEVSVDECGCPYVIELDLNKSLKDLEKELKKEKPEFDEYQIMAMHLIDEVAKAEQEAAEATKQIEAVDKKLDEQYNHAIADAFVGGGLTLVPIALWLVADRILQKLRGFGRHAQETVEEQEVPAEVKKEKRRVSKIEVAPYEARESGEQPKKQKTERSSRPSVEPPVKEEPIDPTKEIQNKLYTALQPSLGECAGKVAGRIIQALGVGTAKKIITDPDITYDVLCKNNDKLSVAFNKDKLSFGGVLNLLYKNKTKMNAGEIREDDLEQLNVAVWYLSKIGYPKAKGLREYLEKAGFSVDAQGAILFRGEHVCDFGGKPKEVIDTCTEFLQRKIAELESPETNKMAG